MDGVGVWVDSIGHLDVRELNFQSPAYMGVCGEGMARIIEPPLCLQTVLPLQALPSRGDVGRVILFRRGEGGVLPTSRGLWRGGSIPTMHVLSRPIRFTHP